MSRRFQVALLLVCGLACMGAGANPPSLSGQEQVQALLGEMLLSANAHDTDRFMAVYSRSPSLKVTFDDLTLRGWQAVRDQQLQWWDNGKSDAVYRLRSVPEISEISPEVIATLQSLEVTSTGPNGAKATLQVVATSIWKKQPEGWRIVLAHESLVQ